MARRSLKKCAPAASILGDEIDHRRDTGYGMKPPVMVAGNEARRLRRISCKKNVPLHGRIALGLVVFGPAQGVWNFDGSSIPASQQTPFYARIQESYRHGRRPAAVGRLWRTGRLRPAGARYCSAEQKAVDGTDERRASLGFDGPRTGMAARLAAPSPMGSLDYISPEALAVMGFV